MKALFLKEIRSFLGSIIGYIVMGVFLILNSLFLWVFSSGANILEGGTADLVSFFTIAPIIFLILIPAITMRSFSEEKRTGTIELLFTRPLTDMQIILAKYFAGLSLVAIAIFPTLIYYFSIHVLGDPVGIVDDGVIIASFIGLFLVGAVFVAVGIFISSLANNQITALIAAVLISWFIYMGLDFLANYSQFGGLDFALRNLGVAEHFTSIQKGILVSTDMIYFVSVIAFFLLATKLKLQSRLW
ncbi:MAG: gliding motility-associated ABC transporter permease subunit GldF [Putridiphycobacter sp.]